MQIDTVTGMPIDDDDVSPRKNAPNPKQAMGDRKVNLALMPSAAVIRMCEALQFGAFQAPRADGQPPGYGQFNWRETKVEAMTYIAAAQRHMLDWVDGEELAPDSLKHHLGHALASLAILVDALETDNLIDNRPRSGAAGRLLQPSVPQPEFPTVADIEAFRRAHQPPSDGAIYAAHSARYGRPGRRDDG